MQSTHKPGSTGYISQCAIDRRIFRRRVRGLLRNSLVLSAEDATRAIVNDDADDEGRSRFWTASGGDASDLYRLADERPAEHATGAAARRAEPRFDTPHRVDSPPPLCRHLPTS